MAETIRQVREQSQKAIDDLKREQQRLDKEVKQRTKAVTESHTDNQHSSNYEALKDELGDLERQAAQLRERIMTISREIVDEKQVVEALSMFDPVWDALTIRSRSGSSSCWSRHVDYDGPRNRITIVFPSGWAPNLGRRAGGGRGMKLERTFQPSGRVCKEVVAHIKLERRGRKRLIAGEAPPVSPPLPLAVCRVSPD